MKILCVIDNLNSGGAQRQLVNLAIGFKERGHEVSFLVYHKLDFFKPQLDKHGISVHYILTKNYLKRIYLMRKFIRSGNQDVVLSFLQSPSFICELSALPKKKWKLIIGERNADPNILKSTKLKLMRLPHLLADYVVANSYQNLEFVKKAIPILPKKKLKVIYNIVNFNFEKNNVTHNTGSKAKIVIAARYKEQKNLRGLVKAISTLPNKYKEKLRIDWYGDKKDDNVYLQNQENEIQKQNLQEIIYLHDKTTQIFEKYLQADFVGLFSYYEGFPNAVCEAMALGKPVIVSKVSDVPLFVQENVNGFLCDPKDTTSIADVLIKAISLNNEQREKMGKTNSEMVKKMFKREVIVDSYLTLFENKRENESNFKNHNSV